MPEELSYVLVTPYSIRKSRTGGIISRLISRSGLDLVRARMFAPSKELVETYAAKLVETATAKNRAFSELLRSYVLRHFLPNEIDPKPRVLLLLFRGENAVARLRATVGEFTTHGPVGETVRDTYGDYIQEPGGRVVYFEPAVLNPYDSEAAADNIRLWASYSDTDAGILKGASLASFAPGTPRMSADQLERTLVLIKPDNFRFPNVRPGGVVDVFSRTGLTIIGAKVQFMSVAQACAFYGPVLEVLKNIFRERTVAESRERLEEALGFPLNDEALRQIGDIVGPLNGQRHWESIVEFMAGTRPSACPEARRDLPGSEKCIALVYEGIDAVRKIREVLGPTDPSKAPPGSIRREFGQTIMVNAAHASDSAENARREMQILQIEENNFRAFVDAFYA